MTAEKTEFDKPLLVLNPKSGNGYNKKLFGRMVAAWPGAKGIWGLDEIKEHPEISADYNLIIAGGGDGTIATIARIAKDYGTAVLPTALGSSSCIPKSLGLGKKNETVPDYIHRLYQDLNSRKLAIREFRQGVVSAGKEYEYLCFVGVGIIAPKILNLIEEAREKKMRFYYTRLAYAALGMLRVFDEKHELTAVFETEGKQQDIKIMDIERLRAGFSYVAGVAMSSSLTSENKDLLITMKAPDPGHKTEQFMKIVSDGILIWTGQKPTTGGIEINKIDSDSEVVVKGNIGKNEVHVDSELIHDRAGVKVLVGQKSGENKAPYRILARSGS